MKPGYYVDWDNDLMVIYPDGSFSLWVNNKDWWGNTYDSGFCTYPPYRLQEITKPYKFIGEL